MEKKIENRVMDYWTERIEEFGKVRKNELKDGLAERWCDVLEKYLPAQKPLKILDVGTGIGYFCILLAKRGHEMTGVDLTPVMIEEARKLADNEGLKISFDEMDAQNLLFEDESFDAVISRNLTWTLPDPERAYGEWFRVLKKEGVLINFDANYGSGILSHKAEKKGAGNEVPYGHTGVTHELEKENREITLAMKISREERPTWDTAVLKKIGFSFCTSDVHVGKSILGELNDPAAPIFLVAAKK
ncbi:class I SAM-dependent methyltransferase [Fusibacter ferrireducens]|uniref:Class I SAM-dependent methyltransferase n=1 Tax=Fusibacter ferrireducens TaxID=2785058 RepID=A0ABR9ZU04_9FIRM|nr:class I SAM-dependent methyltransferase [Fusibacter ferrireducens]MBF4693952.1 class I SAM-dependent methyltransferase [Fusibacter ferrireducens]